MKLNLLLFLSVLTLAADEAGVQPPTTAEVVSRMMEHDRARQAALEGYTARRHYVLENARHHKRAEMLVHMACRRDGSKDFEVVSAAGWGVARNHVFPGLLSAEADASQPDLRERSRITPDNYSFDLVNTETVNDRPAYVIAVTPKTSNKYLMKGRIWVDAEEYAIVRIEGQPAKSPSFWIKSVHFVHTYAKQGLDGCPWFEQRIAGGLDPVDPRNRIEASRQKSRIPLLRYPSMPPSVGDKNHPFAGWFSLVSTP